MANTAHFLRSCLFAYFAACFVPTRGAFADAGKVLKPFRPEKGGGHNSADKTNEAKGPAKKAKSKKEVITYPEVTALIPHIDPVSPDRFTAGYYSYAPSSSQYVTEPVKTRVLAATQTLAAHKPNVLIAALGEMSHKLGGEFKPHNSHDAGLNVDFRLMSKDGNGFKGNYGSKGYDEDYTFVAVKAFIDVDPANIERIYINKSSLAVRIREYLSKNFGKRITASYEAYNKDLKAYNEAKKLGKVYERQYDMVVGPCHGHENHIHIGWLN